MNKRKYVVVTLLMSVSLSLPRVVVGQETVVGKSSYLYENYDSSGSEYDESTPLDESSEYDESTPLDEDSEEDESTTLDEDSEEDESTTLDEDSEGENSSLDDGSEDEEDILDYSEDSVYRYHGQELYPDKDGFVIYDDILIGYEGKKKKVIIPSNVKQIYGVFSESDRLSRSEYTIVIPKSVSYIANAFNIDAIKNVIFEKRGNLELQIGENCFNFNSSNVIVSSDPNAGRVDLPKGTVSIGKKCFTTIKFVSIPNTVKEIVSLNKHTIVLCEKNSYADRYAKKHNRVSMYKSAPYIQAANKTYYLVIGYWDNLHINTLGYDLDDIKVKSSNPSIVKVKSTKSDVLSPDTNINMLGHCLYAKKAGKRVTITLSIGDYSSKITVITMKRTEKNMIKQTIHNASNSSMSKVEKAFNIGYYMAGYIYYDYEWFNNGKLTHKYSPHDAKSALIEHIAVCDGMSKAYQKVLKKAKMKSLVVEGTSPAGVGHAWNLVNLGKNKWAFIDIQIGSRLMSEKELKTVGYKWDVSDYPRAKYKLPSSQTELY